jgi:VIT1/CCC1 family predicted Fe2+/Mn2+ transporter
MSSTYTASLPLRVVKDEVSGARPIPKAPKVKPIPGPLGVVDQVREALKPKARLATFMGFLLGGLVPLASFVVAHHELDHGQPLWAQVALYIVIGGLVYSARTVYDWGKLAFRSGFKSLGFVVLLEGVMVTSSTGWLGLVALAYLIVINGTATACNLHQTKQ